MIWLCWIKWNDRDLKTNLARRLTSNIISFKSCFILKLCFNEESKAISATILPPLIPMTLEEYRCLLNSLSGPSPLLYRLAVLLCTRTCTWLWGGRSSQFHVQSSVLFVDIKKHIHSLASASAINPWRATPTPKHSALCVLLSPLQVHFNVLPSHSSWKCLAPNSPRFLHCLFFFF